LPDDSFVRALPPLVGRCCASLGVRHPLSLRTDLVIDTTGEPNHPPTIYWDGGVGVRDATLGTGIQLDHVSGVVYSRGNYKDGKLDTVVGNLQLSEATLFRQPFRDVRTQFKVTDKEPNVLVLPSVSASLFGGAVYGQVRIDFSRDVDYTIDLTGSQIELEQFGRHNHIDKKSELSGPVFARLYLTGKGSDARSLAGSGSLEMPKGKLYNLPPLIDLLKVLSLRLPDRTFFEEAHAKFDITGPRAHFRELNLFGNWVSLRGRGDMNLDGSDLNLDFHVDWARLNQALPPVIDKIPPLLSDQLLMIKMRGAYGNVHCTADIVPMVTQPFKKMLTAGSESATHGGKP
jgi:AsmA-like C-terminal region